MRPRLKIDVSAIEHNTRLVARLLEPHRVRLAGVTKACLGDPKVAAAMLAGGAAALADSRLDNITRLRQHFPDSELQLLRPALDPDVSRSADLYFVSSADQARLLLQDGSASLRFLLMVETGDGREGVPLELAGEQARRIAALAGAELAGAATNIACASPGAPLSAALAGLEAAAAAISGLTVPRPWLSAGGSGLLHLLTVPESQPAPGSIQILDELRCGEALLLGSVPGGGPEDGSTADNPGGGFLEGARTDAFLLEAAVLEVYQRKGVRQALLAIGSQDLGSAGAQALKPLRDGVRPLAATSDYLAVSLEPDNHGRNVPAIGERLQFIPGYYTLVAAMTSPFVEKVYA